MQKLLVFSMVGLLSCQYIFASLEEEFMQALSSPAEWSKQKEKFNKAINNKEIDIYKLKVTEKSFNGFDFSGMNFQGIIFCKCKFKNVNLKKSNLTETLFWDTSFEKVELDEAILSKNLIFDSKKSSPLALLKWHSDLQRETIRYEKAGQKIQEALSKNKQNLKLVEHLNKVKKNQIKSYGKESVLRQIIGLCKLNLAGQNLSGLNLQEIRLRNVNLTKARLQGANLGGATLKNTSLESADLKKANLKGAFLEKINLINTILKDANLSKARLYGARLSENLVLSENRDEAFKQLKNAKGEEKAIFQNLISAGYNFFDGISHDVVKDLNWKVFDFSHANLSGAQLEEMDLTGINLEGSNLSNTNLKTAVLVNTNLKHTKLFGTHSEKANLTGAQLTNADLDWTEFEESDLTGVNLTEVKSIDHANFSKARLSKDYVLPEKCSTKVLEKAYEECQDEKIKPILKYLASNIKIDNSYFQDRRGVIEEGSNSDENTEVKVESDTAEKSQEIKE